MLLLGIGRESPHIVDTEVVEEGRMRIQTPHRLRTPLPPLLHLRRRSRHRPRSKGRQGHLVGLSRPFVVEVVVAGLCTKPRCLWAVELRVRFGFGFAN